MLMDRVHACVGMCAHTHMCMSVCGHVLPNSERDELADARCHWQPRKMDLTAMTVWHRMLGMTLCRTLLS